MLFHGQALMLQLVFGLVIIQFELCVPIVQVSQLFILKLGFLAKAEVLNHDIPFDFRDVFLCFLNSILSEVIK